MNDFHIWLIVNLPTSDIKLAAELLIRGYSISPAASTGEIILLGNENSSYGVISLHVQRQNVSSKDIYDDMCQIIEKLEIIYYSLIISEFSYDVSWNSGNIKINKLIAPITNQSSKKIIN